MYFTVFSGLKILNYTVFAMLEKSLIRDNVCVQHFFIDTVSFYL